MSEVRADCAEEQGAWVTAHCCPYERQSTEVLLCVLLSFFKMNTKQPIAQS